MVLILFSNTGSVLFINAAQILCLLGKSHIHKSKVTAAKANFVVFCAKLKSFADPLSKLNRNKKKSC